MTNKNAADATAKTADAQTTAGTAPKAAAKKTTAKKPAAARKTTGDKKLVIVESPAKAKTITKFLGAGYKVVASNGHVRDLPRSQLGVDVEKDFEPKYITLRGRGDVLERIRKEAKGAKKIYLATDPDREGEAISWHLAQVLKFGEDEKCRITFNEITKTAVKGAIKEPRAINKDLVDAQQARRILDRLVGYKISPILWAKVRKGLSAGRVQSVATRIIVDREQEINAFIPEEFWNLTAVLGVGKKSLEAKLSQQNGKKIEVRTQAQADGIEQELRGAKYAVREVKRGERLRHPAPPFTTSNLQQEASRKLNFTTKRTMLIAQQLYEGIDIRGRGTAGLVTYIRTDSVRVTGSALEQVRTHIAARYGADYVPEKPNFYKGRKNSQDAHEAIRPTDVTLTPESIKDSVTPDQFKLYRLIYNRFVASQMKDARYETMAIAIDASKGGYGFRAQGSKLLFAGFTAVYTEGQDDGKEEKEVSLPDVTEGDVLDCKEFKKEQWFTQPPARYSEASLVKTLEEKGIGRPSTYAPTITTIIERGYVRREKRMLYSTELGEVVTQLMKDNFANIVDVEFTARMEEELDEVEEGKEDWHKVLREFYGPFEQSLEKAEKTIEKITIEDEVSEIPCPKCGTMMVYKMGRFGRFLACPRYPECKSTMQILEYAPTPCPKCGARLIKRKSKKGGKVFYGCEKYPDCDFISWDLPSGDTCPKCGAFAVFKATKEGKMVRCSNKECGHVLKTIKSEDAADDA